MKNPVSRTFVIWLIIEIQPWVGQDLSGTCKTSVRGLFFALLFALFFASNNSAGTATYLFQLTMYVYIYVCVYIYIYILFYCF